MTGKLYLSVPRLTILALADIVSPEDMYEAQDAITVHLPRAFEHVCAAPYWAHLATVKVRDSHSEAQYLIVRLYEQMSGLQLLPRVIAPQQLAESMVILQDIRANVQASGLCFFLYVLDIRTTDRKIAFHPRMSAPLWPCPTPCTNNTSPSVLFIRSDLIAA